MAQRRFVALNQRYYLLLCGLATLGCITWLYRNHPVLLDATDQLQWTSRPPSHDHAQSSLSSLRVAVVEQEPFHMEVIGAVLHDMLRIGVKPKVFRGSPYSMGFGDVLERFYPYGYEEVFVKGDNGAYSKGPMEDAIRANEFDVVILNSCDWALFWDTPIFNALNESNAQVVCIIHYAQPGGIIDNNARKQIGTLAAQGRISALTLSTHTRDSAVGLFDTWATEDHDAKWDAVPVSYFVPIFPAVADYNGIRKSRIPSNFVIQGTIDTTRRNYDGLLAELLVMMKADLYSWGYRQESDGSPFIALDSSAHGNVPPPFTLHLLGQPVREPIIPTEMTNVVFQDSPDFEKFYLTLSQMDALIPAFSSDEYLHGVSSSSIPAAVMTRTPVLASPAHVRAYGYLAPPGVIVRPSSMTDAEAIALLRAGRDPLSGTAISGTRFNYTHHADWDEYEESILEWNAVTWRSILGRANNR